MARLTIRIKKNTDGTAALSCTRADGTVTWQRQQGAQGLFFPRHDLTHYAVETVLEYRSAFYGLIATGWNISDFGPPWPRGQMPEEAGVAELIVGFLDAERASQARWSAECQPYAPRAAAPRVWCRTEERGPERRHSRPGIGVVQPRERLVWRQGAVQLPPDPDRWL